VSLFFGNFSGFSLCALRTGRAALPPCPGAVDGVIEATAGSCRFNHPSSIRNWLLCSFLPREESAFPSRPISVCQRIVLIGIFLCKKVKTGVDKA